MLDAWYADKMICANCRLTIFPKTLCYLVEIPGETIACSKSCAKLLEDKYRLESENSD